MTRRLRWSRALASVLAAGTSVACAHAPPVPCEVVTQIPGPEDVDVLPPRGPGAVLVSSADRRAEPAPDGQLVLLDLPSGHAEPMPLLDRDACSFHPHGLSTVERHDGRWEVYVVVHLQPADATAPGCAIERDDLEPLPPRLDAIERYELRDDGLHFVQRLSDPLMTNLNDVDAGPDGRLWVSNNPPWVEPRTLVADLILGRRRGQVLLYRPVERQWSVAVRRQLFPNGVAVDPTGEHLFVTGARGRLRHFGLDGVGERSGPPIRRGRARGTLDNLVWDDAGALWTTGHPSSLAFMRHVEDPAAIAPTEVFRVAPGGWRGRRLKARRVLRIDDGRVDAGSVAQPVGDALVIGQVFEPGVAVCRPTTGSLATPKSVDDDG